MKLSGRLAEVGLEPFIEEEFMVGSHTMPKIWILVTDSRQAYFFRKPNHHLEKIGEGFPDEERETEISNQTSGRVANPFGGGRHRMEAHEEALKHETEVFLKSLAKFLDKAATENAFDRLVLVAAPKTLGRIRPMLSKTVHGRVNAELDKDLTHLSEKQLFNYLDKIVWV